MNLQPTLLTSRILAIALLVGLIAAVWQIAAVPIIDAFREQRESLARTQGLLEAYRQRAIPANGLQQRLDSLKNQQHSEAGFLEGTNMAMGSAALQATCKRIMEANGGILRSIQVLPAVAEGDASRILVRIDGSLPNQRLLDFLYDLNTLIPYVFLDNLDIRAPDTANSGVWQNSELTIRADIFGYIRVVSQ